MSQELEILIGGKKYEQAISHCLATNQHYMGLLLSKILLKSNDYVNQFVNNINNIIKAMDS